MVGVATRAVLVTPLSVPLARFGKAGASALALWAERSGVSLEVIDADDSEIERLAVHRACARPGGLAMVGIQTAPTAADALNAAWLGTN